MKLSTEVQVNEFKNKILPTSKIFLCGSCFTSNIGEYFKKYGFQTSINPYGVLFNPFSIESCLKNIISKRVFTKNDFFQDKELWKSYDLHGSHSNNDLKKALEDINQLIIQQHQFLQNSNFVFITLGTSFVFELKTKNKIVANCHKQDSSLFHRKLKSVEEIRNSLHTSIQYLKQINPRINIILTISPVRHWRDGAYQNQVSKSHLFSAIYPIINEQKANYFPAYEIVMDELRDYRFYEQDMLHINHIAIEIIWEKLIQSIFHKSTHNYYSEVSKLVKFINHKPFNHKSLEYKLNLEKNMERLEQIESKYKIKLINQRQNLKQKLNLFN